MLKNGFIWNLPKAEGFSAGTASFRGDDRIDFDKALSNYAKDSGFDTSGAEIYTHPIAFWDGDQILHTQNAVLAGESAAIVDPMTAEGIRPSIFSGVKAAEAINQALNGDRDALAQYTEIIQRDWGSDMVWAQRLANLFYRVPGDRIQSWSEASDCDRSTRKNYVRRIAICRRSKPGTKTARRWIDSGNGRLKI